MCELKRFENISDMRKKIIVCSDGKKIGRINDIIFDSKLNIKSFIIAGSFWEEFRESLGIIDDIDPIVPVEHILEVTEDEIKIDLQKDQLQHKLSEGIITPDTITYNALKRKQVIDYNMHPIGKICNMVFLPCGEAAFILSCPRQTDMTPKGFGTKWDLLLPAVDIESINIKTVKISVKAESLEKTIGEHLLDKKAADTYLNSLTKKNIAEQRALLRAVPGFFMK
jgi:sporulation protein YlmC with PRC-barrel domain